MHVDTTQMLIYGSTVQTYTHRYNVDANIRLFLSRAKHICAEIYLAFQDLFQLKFGTNSCIKICSKKILNHQNCSSVSFLLQAKLRVSLVSVFRVIIIKLFQVEKKRKYFTETNYMTSSDTIYDMLIKVNYLTSKKVNK